MTLPEKPQILIVDDRPENLTAMEALLSDLGYVMVRALSGNEALRLTLKLNFALVLLDVQMPEMDGFETAELLRANPKTRNLPIIFVTAGLKGMNYQFKGYDIGAVDYLTKPIEAPILKSKVRVFCELHSQRLELEQREASLELLVTQRTGELVKTVESLLESHERYRSAFEQTFMGISHLSPDGVFLQVNPAFCKALGYLMNELQNKNMKEIFCPDSYSQHQTSMAKMLSGEILVYTMEEHCFRKDGSTIWFRVNVSLARNNQGKPEYFIRVSEDISENRLLKQQLLQSQKMEAIGLLAGGIAHDFNNILSIIIGYANMLKNRVETDEQSLGYAENVLKASDRAATLTRGLLAFSRKQELKIRPVNLNELVDQTAKLLVRIIGEDISLITYHAADPIIANVDSAQIEQVFVNLVANARDAMPGGGRISITTEIAEIDEKFAKLHGFGMPGWYALVSVTDSGAGIDSASIQYIFEPFFTTKEADKGTGLGLAIVYGIISQHSGYLRVYSEVGIGTTIRFYLPLQERDTTGVDNISSPPPSGGSETILLAEDDEIIRSLETEILEEYGYRVITARDGQEAIERFRENRDTIDLVLLDMIMPNCNGSQACEEIMRIRPGIKVIFITGYTIDLIENKGLLPPDKAEIVMKPVSPQELARRVRAVLDAPE